MNDHQIDQIKRYIKSGVIPIWIEEDPKLGTCDHKNIQTGMRECFVVRDILVEVLGEDDPGIVINYIDQKFEVFEREVKSQNE